jgi:oligopeptide transport system substrate-binding protein
LTLAKGGQRVFSKSLGVLFIITVLFNATTGCGGFGQPETVTVVETVIIEKEIKGETITVVETVEVEKEVVKEVEVVPVNPDTSRIRLDMVIGSEPPSLDPALAMDVDSHFFIEQMFVGLTGFDQNGSVVPELAIDWSESNDGLIWTFKLRDDIHWVHRDPNTGEFEDLGPVTAQDVTYGVARTLDPNTASDYAYVLYPIKGAAALNSADPNAEDFEEIAAGLGVSASDETTVVFELEAPAAYFPSIAALWVAYPQPQAAIEQWGDNWTEAGLIVTNGPYSLRQWTHGAEIWLEKNPRWIKAQEVQIELFGGPIIQEASTAMTMYENNEIDMMGVPGWSPPMPDLDRIKADAQLSAELLIAPTTCTYYYGFLNTKPPFDDPLVRKAFAAAIDRRSLVENVTKGEELPAHSLVPPGVFGSVADDPTIGAFLLEASYADQLVQAQEWLVEAGYPNGEGIDILLMHNTSEAQALIAQAIQAMWQEAFPRAQVAIENQEFGVYLSTLQPDSPIEEKPNVYRTGWCADYPDSNNWLNEVYNSQSGQNFARYSNPEFDALVEEAALESDPVRRETLYRQAESIFIDQDMPIAPIYHYTFVRLYKPWLEPVVSPLGGDPVAEWQLDWEAKQAARGK